MTVMAELQVVWGINVSVITCNEVHSICAGATIIHLYEICDLERGHFIEITFDIFAMSRNLKCMPNFFIRKLL